MSDINDLNTGETRGGSVLLDAQTVLRLKQYRIAEECRRVWNLGLGPISSMAKLAECAGVIVAYVTGVDDKVDAFTVHNNRPVIIRNNAKKVFVDSVLI